MRRLLLLIFMFLSMLAFSQSKRTYGAWVTSPCFKGVAFRFSYGDYNGNNKWMLHYEIANNYNTTIHYNYKITDLAGNYVSGGRKTMRPKQIHSGIGDGCWGLIAQNKGEVKFSVYDVRFGEDDHSPVCNGKNTLYAECDQRAGVPNWPPKCDETKKNSSSNSDNKNSNINNNSTAQTNSEIENLNQYLTKIPDSDAEKIRIINDANAITNSTSLTDSQKAGRIKGLAGQARLRAERLSSEETARKAEEDRQRKILEERDGFMRNHLQKGDDAYNSGQYANAKIHYSNALGFATTDEQRQQIQAAISKAQLAIEAEARRQRVEQKQKVEQQNNTAAAASVAAGIGILALLEDEESDEFFSARFRFGLGIEWVPLLTNSSMKQKTRTDILAPINLNLGFRFTVGNDKPVSLHLSPEGSYGLAAFSAGSDGSMYTYGGLAAVHAGRSQESMFKAVVEAGYIKRGGSFNYDGDVASGGTTATDEVYNGEFNYGITRLGGGVLFQIHDYDEIKFFMKPMYYFDKFSFAPVSRYTKVVGISIGSTKIGIIDILFSKGYGIGGSIDYPQSFNPSSSLYDEDYFQIRYSRQVKIK